MPATTKAQLQARVAELEAQLTASTSDPKADNMIRLVGLLKGVKEITRDGGKRTVSCFLSNTTTILRDGDPFKVDLPIDSVIATDNGVPIATDILSVWGSTEWARVAISGYWTSMGEVLRNERGFHFANRRQLRAQRIEVLSFAPAGEPAPRFAPTQGETPF